MSKVVNTQNPDDELVTVTMQLGGKITHEPSTYPIPRPQKSDNLSGEQIIAMLKAKGTDWRVIAYHHHFNCDDVLAVINGEQMYPNIARIIAAAIGATKEMVWPSIYCATPAANLPNTSIFVLRVQLA